MTDNDNAPQGWQEIAPPLEPEPEITRKMTVAEAIEIAMQLQKNKQLDQAREVYQRIFDVRPDQPDALHHAGVLAHQLGKSDEAIALIERSLAIAPDRADCYNNLGIILQQRDRFEEAIAAYQRAIALDASHANAYSNLGVLLRATGKPAEAEEAYRTAIRFKPDHVDAYTNLGILLKSLGRMPEAVACFSKVITLRPKHKEARRLMAHAHCTIGEIDKAMKIYEEWLEEEPDAAIPRHMLAACTQRDIPLRASDAYVETTFDNFAASFDSKLANLKYRAPALVAAIVDDLGLERSRSLAVLDIGCGTGLCGPLVAPYARRLTGVDLSAGMLAQAKQRNVYDELIKGELTDYLRESSDAYDLVVSADTLVYFGGLEEVLAAAAGALRPGGFFVFTLEHLVAPDANVDYRLEPHGRYSHARAYVERILAGVDLAAVFAHADLRMESGAPVAGLVIRAAKPHSEAMAAASASKRADSAAERGVGERDGD